MTVAAILPVTHSGSNHSSRARNSRPRPPRLRSTRWTTMHPYLRNFSLDGQVALVTGAGRGLGFSIARALAQSGAQVIVNGRDGGRLLDAARLIDPDPMMVSPMPFDVTDEAAVGKAFDLIRERHGRLDILVNNVGARDRKPFFEFSSGDMRALLEADLVAAMLLSQAAARLMTEHRHGRLIAVTSIAGHLARAGDAVYAVAKHGLNGLVRGLAAEYGATGITSNAIAPGGFATEANAAAFLDPKIRAHFAGRTPLGRWGEPDEIAGAAVFLASPAASYVNGHVLVVDGGMSISM
jgi:gluconate 5-dehydrogenase